jgi:protein-L-isoaspartate(D-aspartate) O-methyltransferase
MLELLQPAPQMRCLEIGAGTGYNAALLAEVAGRDRVTTIEADPDAFEEASARLFAAGYGEVRCERGDGFFGYEPGAPFDRIVATVGCGDVSPHWIAQLSSNGLMLLPVDYAGTHPLLLMEVVGEAAVGRVAGWRAGFVTGGGQLCPSSHWSAQRWTGESYDRLLSSGQVVEHDVWADLRAAGGPVDWDTMGQRFWLFLTLSTPLAWRTPDGYGIRDPARGWALVRGDHVGVHGDSALWEELNGLHDAWLSVGSPSVTDYRMTFTREPVQATWMIKRANHYEAVIIGNDR